MERRDSESPVRTTGVVARLLVLALWSAACRAAPPLVDPAAIGAARFPGASTILAGFDATEAGAEWRAGDRVLYALSTESRKGTQAKLIELELVELCAFGPATGGPAQIYETVTLSGTVGSHALKWSSPLLRVAVRVYEIDGRLAQQTEAKVPETVLRSGMYPALRLTAEWMPRIALAGGAQTIEPTDEEARIFAEAAGMLPTLLALFQDDGVLESLLMQVVGTPPLLSLLSGIQVGVSGDLEKSSVATDLTNPCSPSSIYRLPVRLAVNETPMVDLELDVVAADPPLRLSGGILAMSGVACGGSERKVTLELLAARRGPPGAEIRLGFARP
jgi:hypothetical protein